MNTKNNQRAKDTREKIIQSVYRKIAEERRPVSKITVREICEEAGINRSTFYAHFMDVYDVVEKVEKWMSEGLTRSVLQEAEKASSINSLFEQTFRFVEEHQEFYSVYFLEMHQSDVIGIAWELLRDKTEQLSYQEMGFRNQREMEYAGAFFIYGITAILRLWLEGGCKETPAEMVDVIARQYSIKDREQFYNWNREE